MVLSRNNAVFDDFFKLQRVLVERTSSNDKQLIHEIEVPGVKLSDIVVTMTYYCLDIVIKHKSGDIKRSYTLSDKFDPAGCKAKLENGVLYVTFPAYVHQKQESRLINIET